MHTFDFKNFFIFFHKKHICFCLCYDTRLKHISESAACNIPCRQSLNNGKCGGNGFFSVYESMIGKIFFKTDRNSISCKYYSTTIHSSFFILFRVYKFVSLKNTSYRLFWNDILNLEQRNNKSNMMWLEHWSKANNSNQIAFTYIFSFSVHTHLSDTHTPLGGFCLTCLAQTSSNKTMLSSMDCDANASGYCGKDFKFTWTIYIKLSSLYNLETYKNHILNDLQTERSRKEIWILVMYNLYRSILYTNSILPIKKV